MRRVGVVLLTVGLVVFLIASSLRGGYESMEGMVRTAFSKEERGKKEFWETARWLSAGMAIVGLVLVVAPGKKV